MKRRSFLKDLSQISILTYFPELVFAEKEKKEALFYHLQDDKIQCDLCPHHCLIGDQQRGFCRVRLNDKGKLYAENYYEIAAVNIDPIEKKPFYHFLPAKKALSLAAPGCNLRCQYCQNWKIAQSKVSEVNTTCQSAEKITKATLNNHVNTVAFTYSEPVVFYETTLNLAKEAKKRSINTLMISAGFINQKPLEKLLPYMDGIKIDLKSFNNVFYKTYCSGELEAVLKTIKTIYKSKAWLEIVNLIVPGLNDSDKEIKKMCQWIFNEIGTDVPVHFSRFFPNYRMKSFPPTPIKTIMNACDIAKEQGLHYVYAGNANLKKYNTTYCPACGLSIIERYGYYVTKNIIKDGKCPECSAPIAGFWPS